MRIPKIVFASALLAFPGIAQAADAPCLTRAEFSALAAYALPSLIEGANARCAQSLGPGAYLSKRGGELVERYAAAEDANWPVAKAAFLKMSAKTDNQANNIMKLLPDETQQEMFGQIIQAMVVQEIPPEHCGTIDEFARLLSPLPAQNTAEILTLIVSLAGSSKQGTGKSPMGKLRICQD
jgi:hypothetical protein